MSVCTACSSSSLINTSFNIKKVHCFNLAAGVYVLGSHHSPSSWLVEECRCKPAEENKTLQRQEWMSISIYSGNKNTNKTTKVEKILPHAENHCSVELAWRWIRISPVFLSCLLTGSWWIVSLSKPDAGQKRKVVCLYCYCIRTSGSIIFL